MDFLTTPFTTAILFLYQFLGQNIVLTIVVFTVLIRLLTFPLTQQQINSSKEMQAVQPKMKKLQEKYKGDREKLAAEQMKLYREHKINPLMGCLPLLIQLPILLGLYGAIQHALAATPLQLLDLQHRLLVPSLSTMIPLQNQFAWLNLAQPDPLYILPILVVATTWLQSKLMTPPPANADPNDPQVAMSRNMTLMMPLMIGMFSLQFASGLSIYWVVSNLAGIAQYAFMGKVDWGSLIGRPRKPEMMVPNNVELDDDDDDEDVALAPKAKPQKAIAASTSGSTSSVASASGNVKKKGGIVIEEVDNIPTKKKNTPSSKSNKRK
jgi:YidC/Oxa1 family membrane protein insertase